MKHVLIVAAVLFAAVAFSRDVTLTARAPAGTNFAVTELSIGPYETAELLSFPVAGPGTAVLEAVKDGQSICCFYFWGAADPVIIAGPATLRLQAFTDRAVFCTFRITPEAFPPDRTIIVSPGTNQTQITLECSTNLVQWFPATNGVYGPLPEAKFFRIKAQKL